MSGDDPSRTGRRDGDPDLAYIGTKLDALIDLLKQQNEQLKLQHAQNQRAAEMLRAEFHSNRELGRELVAVLIDLQIERDHQLGANGRTERLERLSEKLVAVSVNGGALEDK